MDHVVDEGDDGDIFFYRGGRAPQHITHVLIDKSVNEIVDGVFSDCRNLLQVDTHDGIRRVGREAFAGCRSLRRINLISAVVIDFKAFSTCLNLESVEFGDRLETIGSDAFGWTSLTHAKLPSIITIRDSAFYNCQRLADVELSERLETVGRQAFKYCEGLQRIAIPLKRDLFEFNHDLQRYNQFADCYSLTTVDLVGQAHTKTIASFHMESWRADMNELIHRINEVLPSTLADDKTEVIRQWMELVLDQMDHYKSEHYRYVKEGITLLELALWKAKLGEKEESSVEGKTKKAKVDAESARKGKRITCGAEMVIKNVLPFLQLE